uniref:Uncharacterized protein ycf35 n=1 Tax=Membranoptera platyphylla TaxID=1204437 RepID=A0A1I9KQD4_9FLOR|nr:conserved hypothetical plastid protein [Membranoptera platyphylla]AMJ16843.1 conserved hypothetical plastid protein [Membranoptera platyphylla]
MSHFSKIKTNISDIEILKKTLKDLGFTYGSTKCNLSNVHINYSNQVKYLNVYDSKFNTQTLFEFIWDGYEYNFVADFNLWHLNMSVDYFLEKLSQQYAYNVILNQSIMNGFNETNHIFMKDGSIKVVMQKWND